MRICCESEGIYTFHCLLAFHFLVSFSAISSLISLFLCVTLSPCSRERGVVKRRIKGGLPLPGYISPQTLNAFNNSNPLLCVLLLQSVTMIHMPEYANAEAGELRQSSSSPFLNGPSSSGLVSFRSRFNSSTSKSSRFSLQKRRF